MAGFHIQEFEGRVPCPLCGGKDCAGWKYGVAGTVLICMVTGKRPTQAQLQAAAEAAALPPRKPEEITLWRNMPLSKWQSDPPEVSRWQVIKFGTEYKGSASQTLYRCRYKGPVAEYLRRYVRENSVQAGAKTIKMGWTHKENPVYAFYQDDRLLWYATLEKVE